ncbi:DUF4082 domain-containing protein [Nostoc sp. 'Peltigera membranacea cyanobiont' 213]|uniref:DUF4082 domain-containing protein n=1 Tax=Nostoc sp. 'Peltigera membranacea cyanobiont' 213 TaxID=2014530 RepID=UPI00167CB26A|nr:DUF4082 domain-containing protein [Nostoc sp. 'Peltigera membranacea cyanobiont' 213]
MTIANVLKKLSMASPLILATVLVSAPSVYASEAIQSLTGGTNFTSVNNTNQTIGWSFTANDNLSVTALGFYDQTPGNPLSQSHLVGLWTSDGNLLASTTVQTTSPLTGSFRYEDITSVNLLAGISYVIGAAITSPFTDIYNIPGVVNTAPEITLTGSARNGTSQGFSFPSTLTAGNGRIGPNFKFDVVTQAVPEPTSLIGILGLGAFGITSLRKRKQLVTE